MKKKNSYVHVHVRRYNGQRRNDKQMSMMNRKSKKQKIESKLPTELVSRLCKL